VTSLHPLAHGAATLLGGEVAHTDSLAGGYMGPVVRVVLADGRRVVAKSGPSPRTEAAMLRAIVAAGAPAPRVLAVDEHVLVLEERAERDTLDTAWGDLGSVLATLHATTNDSSGTALAGGAADTPRDGTAVALDDGAASGSANGPAAVAAREGTPYGWEEDYAFGPLAIPNAWQADWPTFWGRQRLLAHEARLPSDVRRRVQALVDDLPNRLPARPRASLLHGDLWIGNVLVDGPRVSALIDPASHFGHAEVDLAMLTLFGNPDQHFYAAYPFERGWAERRAIYQLWPGLVHLQLFGSAYRGMVSRLLREAGI
jgi:fructosamine-3-kinase